MAKLQKVRANENIEVINHILKQDGCIVIENVLDKHELDKLKRELCPALRRNTQLHRRFLRPCDQARELADRQIDTMSANDGSSCHPGDDG